MKRDDWTTEICDFGLVGIGRDERNCIHIGFDLQATSCEEGKST